MPQLTRSKHYSLIGFSLYRSSLLLLSLCGRFGVVKQANSLPLEENDRYSTEILHALTILCSSYHSHKLNVQSLTCFMVCRSVT